MLSLAISGDGVERMRQEAGGHRIQRVPPTETRGRVHTSTVTVAVLGGLQSPQESRTSRIDNPQDFDICWFSGSGAGGQNRNKKMACCRITHISTGIVRSAQTRSRENSYRLAMAALIEELDRLAAATDHAEVNDARKRQLGSGERGDKRRTLRFQNDLATDHVSGRRSRVSDLMAGRFELLWH